MSDAGEAERPWVAGMYDYYLGGTANSAADRAAVERVRAIMPEVSDIAWANRGFLQRAVARMAQDWGIRQFLDIGAGLPTQRNTHDIVRESVGPDEKTSVVYVDMDPRVITRSAELLDGVPGTAVILGDLREPDAVLADPVLRGLIDFTQPVGLLLVSVTAFVQDHADPWGAVRRFVNALAPGSYLALSQATADHQAVQIKEEGQEIYRDTPSPGTFRTKDQTVRFFDGLQIVPPYPGAAPEVTFAGLWDAEDPVAAADDGSRWMYVAVARKPGPGTV
jgi:hypothetical protein